MALHAVTGPEQGRDLARWQQQLNSPDTGVVSFAVRPSTRRDYALTWDALGALGKTMAVTGAGRDADNAQQLLLVWLLAHEIRHLVVRRAEWAAPKLLDPLISLTEDAGCDLWICAHDVSDELGSFLDAHAFRRLDWDTFRAEWHRAQPATAHTNGTAAVAFPDIPDDDFPSFAAAVRSELYAGDAGIVLDRLAAARAATAAWADRTELTEEALAEHIHALFDDCATEAEMITSMRGVQLALFTRGHLVQLDLLQLLATAPDAPRRACRPPELWSRLRVYLEPYRGAACALAAARFVVDDIAAVTVADVPDDGAHVATPHGPVTIEPPARVFLRAQRIQRRHDGAAPTDPFLARRGTSLATRPIANAIQAARRETGLAVMSSRIERRAPTGRTWTRRYGISLQEL